jgi:hypothetical protein
MAAGEPTHNNSGPEMNGCGASSVTSSSGGGCVVGDTGAFDDFFARNLVEINVPKVVGPTVASRFLRMWEGELLETA